MNTLSDTDPMPFGKYKGKPMQDVDVKYLHWLWHNGLKNKIKYDEVADYINRNLHALSVEYKDAIWS